jgi:hypothetical protein
MVPVDPDAIAELRQLQLEGRMGRDRKAPAPPTDLLARALARVDDRERGSRESGGYLYSPSGFRYPAVAERERWSRTREVLTRVSPGPDEDAEYLEALARQAAAVEMGILGRYGSMKVARGEDICDRVLLGTVQSNGPDAYSRAFQDYYFVLVEAGLIDFLRCLANAAILSWRPITPSPDPLHPRPANAVLYSFKHEPADIEAVLRADAYPLELLRRTLSAYVFEGQPRIEIRPPPSIGYQMPLAALIDTSERFLIAHEYGHTLHDEIAANAGNAWVEEFFADTVAFRYAIISARVLDGLPPPYAMSGGFFVPMALEILRRTLDIIRVGRVQADTGFDSHPPLQDRWANLRRLYLAEVSNKHDENAIYGAEGASVTLEYLWSRLVKEGVAEWRSGRKVHSMWDGR